MKKNALVVIGSSSEAREALQFVDKKSVFLATSLDAEFFLKTELENYQNPIYLLFEKVKNKKQHDYVFNNFKTSYDFCSNQYLQYVRDRLGYFLAELERSYDLAQVAIKMYKPEFVVIGNIKNYLGSSVVDGNLITNAFLLIVKSRGLKYSLVNKKSRNFHIRQIIGKQIQRFRYMQKQTANKKCDLLVLATPAHLIKLTSLVNELKSAGLSVAILTYSLTNDLKKEMDNNFGKYFEKERLINSKILKEAKLVKAKLIKGRVWEKFENKKYKKNPIVINYVKSKIEDIVKNEMENIFLDIFLSRKILSDLSPRALLVTTDPDSKILPYINSAKKMNINTICLQHGAFNGNDSPAIYPESDFFITWSKTSRNWLQKSEYFKKVKMIVGRYPFKVLLGNQISRRNKLRLKILYLATKQPTVSKVVVISYLKKLFENLSNVNEDFEFFIRLHPFQNMANFKSLAKNFKGKVFFENEKPLGDLIQLADIVLYENTTAGFEAMLAGKPTVYFNPYSGVDFFDVKSHDASLTILNDKDLESKLLSFIHKKETWKSYAKNGKEFAENYFGLNKTMANLANDLVKLI